MELWSAAKARTLPERRSTWLSIMSSAPIRQAARHLPSSVAASAVVESSCVVPQRLAFASDTSCWGRRRGGAPSSDGC